ncbi:MAG TPA: periplasmic heavy metal sensor [Pyrinomonadaceae bacterium]|nr:periplasmic heavy metal sensor [Pyrinomonadaceae bacterium]
MKHQRIKSPHLLLATFLLLAAAFVANAQTTTPPGEPQDKAAAQPAPTPNLQQELNLTPDQIQKWRELNRELRPQEVDGQIKVRQARRALTEAMESPTPNEDLIKQRAKDLADAQSAMTQLQALRQARVLQILTPEQRIKLREIREHQREQAQELKRQQQQMGNGLNQRQQMRRQNATVLTPAQRKALRQQKPKL